MKKLFRTTAPLVLLLFGACGDAGIGFNITRNVPIVFKITVPGNDPGVEINPPAFTQTFRLADVTAFQDVLSDLAASDAIAVNSITYSIADVSHEEEVPIDNISLTLTSATEEQVSVLDITGSLRNIPETPAGVNDTDRNGVKEILTHYQEVDNTLTFDFAEVPASDLNFTFTLFYNITLRVRY
jgi:hypothetical protein